MNQVQNEKGNSTVIAIVVAVVVIALGAGGYLYLQSQNNNSNSSTETHDDHEHEETTKKKNPNAGTLTVDPIDGADVSGTVTVTLNDAPADAKIAAFIILADGETPSDTGVNLGYDTDTSDGVSRIIDTTKYENGLYTITVLPQVDGDSNPLGQSSKFKNHRLKWGGFYYPTFTLSTTKHSNILQNVGMFL